MRRLHVLLLVLWTISGSHPLSAADNVADLSGWPRNRLPVAAEWALGHDFPWNVGQVREGRRLLPTLGLPVRAQINGPNQQKRLDAWAADLGEVSSRGLPLVLRHQSQLSQDAVAERGTWPDKTAATWRIMPEDMTRKDGTVIPAGTLDSEPQCDCFGPASLWSEMGRAYGSSGYLARLQQHCPHPAWIGLWDNNEGYYPEPNRYCVPDSRPRRWRTREALTGLSLKMRDRVDQLGYDSAPEEFWPEFYLMRQAQYLACYGGFRDSWSAWKGKPFLTNAYSTGWDGHLPAKHIVDQIGYAPESLCFDGGGPACYLGGQPASLLKPLFADRVIGRRKAWEWSEAHNPNAFRTVFVSINARGALAAAADGQVITPDLFRAWCEGLAWLARPPKGGPVLLQHWIRNATRPDDPFFAAEFQAQLAALGRPELKAVTQGEYSLAPARAADSICRDEVRDYWREGANVPATVSDDRVRIAACQRGASYLLYLWSPFPLEGQVRVSLGGREKQIDSPSVGSAYWILASPTGPARKVLE